jgi:hypothetical protein
MLKIPAAKHLLSVTMDGEAPSSGKIEEII